MCVCGGGGGGGGVKCHVAMIAKSDYLGARERGMEEEEEEKKKKLQ